MGVWHCLYPQAAPSEIHKALHVNAWTSLTLYRLPVFLPERFKLGFSPGRLTCLHLQWSFRYWQGVGINLATFVTGFGRGQLVDCLFKICIPEPGPSHCSPKNSQAISANGFLYDGGRNLITTPFPMAMEENNWPYPMWRLQRSPSCLRRPPLGPLAISRPCSKQIWHA